MRAKLAGVCLFAAALALAAGADAQQGAGAPTTITDIRQESAERSTRLVVECTGPLAYTYYSPDPLTLVVDIPDVDASQVPARVNVGTREVESLRVTNLARADGRNLAEVLGVSSVSKMASTARTTIKSLTRNADDRTDNERRIQFPLTPAPATPWNQPISAPKAMAKTTAMIQIIGLPNPIDGGSHSTCNSPAYMPTTPTMEPTDRSMLRVMMTSTIPVAMIPMEAVCTLRFHRLRGVRKVPL